MSAVYTNFCGMIVSETRSGVERDYVPDTLGSTAALVDNMEAVTDRWEYWPYGEVSQRTGTSTTPFTFVGILGYFKDLLDNLFYVRARYLKANLARWLTVDPLWPDEPAYGMGCSPLSLVDPTGAQGMAALCLITCWGYPGGPCEYARAKGVVGKSGGGIVCCEGVKHLCDWLSPGGPPGIHACVLAHEQEHYYDVDCPLTGFSRPGFRSPENADRSECVATDAEIACLLKRRKGDCGEWWGVGVTECQAAYHRRLCRLCAYLDEHKCPKPKFCQSC
ncbi:MAG TPA: hypothetical protein VK934_03290 [Fimbriimonas sp.]|nr:hypothetical protein [Fimbriimonas sp.]